MPCTEAKRNANRQNATKSTGPRTPQGKARSSKNALRHGFCAAGSALTPLEDRQAYEAYTAAIMEGLRPATAMEDDLATRIADLSWRLRRIPDAESALLARDTVHDLARRCASPRPRTDDEDEHDEAHDDEHDDEAQREQDRPDRQDEEDEVTPDSPARLLAAAMSARQNPYLTLQRYEASLDRARSRALKELRQLQKDRREHAAAEEEAPRESEPMAPSPPEGEGWGEGEAPERRAAPLRNEPTPQAEQVTSDKRPMTPTQELRNEPTAPAAHPSRPLRAFPWPMRPGALPSRLPHPQLPNEPNPPSVSTVSSAAEPDRRSQIANPNSQIERPPQRFLLKPSDLRPLHVVASPEAKP